MLQTTSPSKGKMQAPHPQPSPSIESHKLQKPKTGNIAFQSIRMLQKVSFTSGFIISMYEIVNRWAKKASVPYGTKN